MGPIWGRQDPCGPHVGPKNFAIWGLVAWWHKAITRNNGDLLWMRSCAIHGACFGFLWLDMRAKVIQLIVQPHTPWTYELIASWLACVINFHRPGRSCFVVIYIFLIGSLFIYSIRNSIPPIMRFLIWKLCQNGINNKPTFMFSDWQFDWSANNSCRDGAILMNSMHVIVITTCQLWYKN